MPLLLLLLTDFTHCSDVSIVDFEQVNTDWAICVTIFFMFVFFSFIRDSEIVDLFFPECQLLNGESKF